MLESVIAMAMFSSSRLRPPSVPLITHDPYFSIWSPADHAYDRDTTHWTGAPQALNAVVTVDGKQFQLVGKSTLDPLPQIDLLVTATQSTYTFANANIEVIVSFASPLLPHDLDIYSRPVSYVSFEASSKDQKDHKVEFQFSVSANVAVNTSEQHVTAQSGGGHQVKFVRVGSVEQPVLAKRGDDLRIDWGHAYLASDKSQNWDLSFGATKVESDPAKTVHLSARKSLGTVRHGASWLMVAYDDEVGLQYFDAKLLPYWRRNGANAVSVLDAAAKQHDSVLKLCDQFDRRLQSDLKGVGGEKYAQICALGYRQAVAGTKLVADAHGRPLLFPKENFSNGCIGTVDVIYPMAPLFFLLGPDLAKAMLVPVLDYGASKRWRFPFAPHDLGTYPQATGQVYGGGEDTEDNQMPVEESGNMILLVAAMAKIEGNAAFAKKYWPHLTQWAEYLKAKGLDPANQLCTDDFMGHLAHNANLSVKAILALGAYGQLATTLGHEKEGTEYINLAHNYAQKWVGLATEGDHTKLAFDREGTWSQKYNMVWDDILGLNVFSSTLKKAEVNFYLGKMNRYGLPLDNRSPGMKVDWLCWTATLSHNTDDFEKLISPVWDFLNETTDRVPICDWVHTDSPKHIGMIARPVLGGAFLPVLQDRDLWLQWIRRGVGSRAEWAPIPIADRQVLVASAKTQPAIWKYSLSTPDKSWYGTGFDDSAWKAGQSGFGSQGTPGAIVHTEWTSDDIWLRRVIEIPKCDPSHLRLSIHHDEDAEVYINGVLAAKLNAYTSNYVEEPLLPAALKAIRFDGPNLVAVHCHQTTGGQYIDLGFSTVVMPHTSK